MTGSFLKRRKILKGANYLELTPVRLHDSEISDKGEVVIMVPKFKNRKLNILVPTWKSDTFRLKLDEIGSACWQSIDGNRTVDDICSYLSETLGDKVRPVEERVTKFLTQLYESRHITFREIQ